MASFSLLLSKPVLLLDYYLSHNFRFIHEFVTIVMDSGILLFGVLPWFWNKSGDILESMA